MSGIQTFHGFTLSYPGVTARTPPPQFSRYILPEINILLITKYIVIIVLKISLYSYLGTSLLNGSLNAFI